MSLRASDVDRAWEKLGMEIRETNDKHALFRYQGKIILRTKRSFGSSKIEGKVQHFIRQQMRLSESDFDALITCPLKLEGYIEILKQKKVIE